jgi:anion-transporting  ArsA/GET3 family ATPase
MALDVQRTFDTLVERYAPDPAARRRILDNRFYRQISAALAGSHEYMAMEKLLELSADPRFDLIVLDTPPTRHALDFLEAPERLMGFLDAGVLRFFLKPYFVAGRLTLKVASRTGALALRIADAVLGLQFLQDLSEFFLAFESMYAGFKERAQRVFELLRDRRSGFVLVAAPARLALDEGLYFYRRLAEKEMPFVSFVVNRVHPEPASSGPGRRRSSPARPLDPALGAALLQVYDDQRTLARLDQRNVARLAASTREDVIVVPEFEADVHDLRGLLEFGAAIFGLRSPGLARSRGATAPALESAPR